MFAPRFRHPVAVIVGILLFLFQSVADAREVGCSHHFSGEEPAAHADAHSPAPAHSAHNHTAGASARDGAHAHDLVASSADELPAGEHCDCGPLCSGLASPPPPLPEAWARVRTSWTPTVLSIGTGPEVLPVHRIPPALLNLPPPPAA